MTSSMSSSSIMQAFTLPHFRLGRSITSKRFVPNMVQIHTFLVEFVDFLTLLLQENSQPIIIGDFNVLWNLPDHTDT